MQVNTHPHKIKISKYKKKNPQTFQVIYRSSHCFFLLLPLLLFIFLLFFLRPPPSWEPGAELLFTMNTIAELCSSPHYFGFCIYVISLPGIPFCMWHEFGVFCWAWILLNDRFLTLPPHWEVALGFLQLGHIDLLWPVLALYFGFPSAP